MRKLLPWGAAVLAGIVVGALGLKLLETPADTALEHQKSELVRLTSALREKEAALAASQARLDGQAARIHLEVTRAADLADQILGSQGSAIDRLKRLIIVVRQLQSDLKAFN